MDQKFTVTIQLTYLQHSVRKGHVQSRAARCRLPAEDVIEDEVLEGGCRDGAFRQQIRLARDHEGPVLRPVREAAVRAFYQLRVLQRDDVEQRAHAELALGQ